MIYPTKRSGGGFVAKGSAISVYLDSETLAALDAAVAKRAALDRENGLTGHQVTSRSSFISQVITDFLHDEKNACPSIHDIRAAVIPLAKDYGAQRVSLFGAYASGEQTEESVIDILLDKGDVKGIQVFKFRDDLARALGRRVDVTTAQGLNESLAAHIAKNEVVLYVR